MLKSILHKKLYEAIKIAPNLPHKEEILNYILFDLTPKDESALQLIRNADNTLKLAERIRDEQRRDLDKDAAETDTCSSKETEYNGRSTEQS